jgi:hypothetical protein
MPAMSSRQALHVSAHPRADHHPSPGRPRVVDDDVMVAADDEALRVVRGVARGLALAAVAWAALALALLLIFG